MMFAYRRFTLFDRFYSRPLRSYDVPRWGEVCNGHGTCGYSTSFVCQCNEGYTGRYCQRMACATGSFAWFDEATDVDTAHASGYECSNRGNCNADEGLCECAPGFEGRVSIGSYCRLEMQQYLNVCSFNVLRPVSVCSVAVHLMIRAVVTAGV